MRGNRDMHFLNGEPLDTPYRGVSLGMAIFAPLSAPFEDRLAHALQDRGLPVATVFEAVLEAAGTTAPTGLTDAEARFAVAGGVPDTVLNGEDTDLALRAALLTTVDSLRRGPKLTTNEVAELLGRDPANVRRMLKNGDLFAAGQIERQTAYPSWQFTDGGVLPHLRQVIAALPAGYHARDIEVVMTSAMAELNGRTPREWLESDGAVEMIVSLLDELSLS